MTKKLTGLIAAFGLMLCSFSPTANAGTWTLPAGGTWNAAASWNPAVIPNATGDNATFNNAASGSNPAQTGNRIVNLDGSKTVGSIDFNNDAANGFTNTIATGSGGPLVFDEVGAGPATIDVNSIVGATGNNTISVAMSLTDIVVANVNNVTASSAAGALNLTGAISGPGGVTKNGDGLMTFGTGAKTYTGPTVLNGGRTRMSLAAHAQSTSGLTINPGGQLTLISAGNFAFGPNAMSIGGNGPSTGPFSPFPGAIRNDTNLAVTINNAIVLQAGGATIHVQGSTTGSTTLLGNISGPGGFTAGANPHDANLGRIDLNGTNSYQGGTTVRAGNLVALAASVNALGTGDVTVESASLVFGGSQAKLTLNTGATNVIDDSAYLFLSGGAAPNTADDGHADLGAGINEIVRRLYLGGLVKIAGTYGSTASAATYKNDEYFAGTGIVTVLVPEPTSFALVLLGMMGMVGARRGR
jgi:autotransporter-associated beta strand protein